MKTAPELLKRAAEIMDERGKQYDKPHGERSMRKTIDAFNAITGRDLAEAEGWLLMLVLKQARLFQRPGYHADSAEDAIAYASLLAEAKQQEAFAPGPAVPPLHMTAEEEVAFNDLMNKLGKANG